MTYQLSPADIRRARSLAITDRRAILDIAEAVAQEAGVTLAQIQSHRRSPVLSQARWLIAYIAHVDEGHTVEAIGLALRKHHTSISYGVQRERERRACQ